MSYTKEMALCVLTGQGYRKVGQAAVMPDGSARILVADKGAVLAAVEGYLYIRPLGPDGKPQ